MIKKASLFSCSRDPPYPVAAGSTSSGYSKMLVDRIAQQKKEVTRLHTITRMAWEL